MVYKKYKSALRGLGRKIKWPEKRRKNNYNLSKFNKQKFFMLITILDNF